MGAASSILLCSSNSSTAIAQPAPSAPAPQSLYCHHCRGVISSGPSAYLAGQGRFGLNGNGLAECPRCRGNFVEVLTDHERRRIQVASPLRQVRVAATNIMPGRRVTANDIVYTFFLFDSDVQRDLFRDSDLDAAISQSLDEAAASPQKATSKVFIETLQRTASTVCEEDISRQQSCPVCDEQLNLDEIVIRLSCKHVFHENCLTPWLAHHNTCPICRTELPSEPEDNEIKKPSQDSSRRAFHMIQGQGNVLPTHMENRPPTPVMEAAGIEAHSPSISPRIGETPRSPAVSMEVSAAIDQDADTDSTGQNIVEEAGQSTELVSANRSDITAAPDAEERDCPDACPELEMGTASSASQCPADAALDSTRYSNIGCAQDLDIQYSNQDCQQVQGSSHVQQPEPTVGCEPARTEAGGHENSGLAIGRREDEEDLDALMQELAELNPLRSPRPDDAAVSITACPP